MQDLNISLFQADLAWEDPQRNLGNFDHKLATIHYIPDLFLLPEMFNTGFSMQVEKCAETINGPTMRWLKEKAQNLNCVLGGSLLIAEHKKYYNRFVWMNPDGTFAFYNKRHLFSMAGEDTIMSAGQDKKIIYFKGWKIALQVCYDLRFPVWSKNTYHSEKHAYDVLIYIANWPEIRKEAYQRLLPARAIENQSYVVWVNRVGKDGMGINHSGDSAVYDPSGNLLALAEPGSECLLQATLSFDSLLNHRSKFKIGPDWDTFDINT